MFTSAPIISVNFHSAPHIVLLSSETGAGRSRHSSPTSNFHGTFNKLHHFLPTDDAFNLLYIFYTEFSTTAFPAHGSVQYVVFLFILSPNSISYSIYLYKSLEEKRIRSKSKLADIDTLFHRWTGWYSQTPTEIHINRMDNSWHRFAFHFKHAVCQLLDCTGICAGLLSCTSIPQTMQRVVCGIKDPSLVVDAHATHNKLKQLYQIEGFSASQDVVLENAHGRLVNIVCTVSSNQQSTAVAKSPRVFAGILESKVCCESRIPFHYI